MVIRQDRTGAALSSLTNFGIGVDRDCETERRLPCLGVTRNGLRISDGQKALGGKFFGPLAPFSSPLRVFKVGYLYNVFR